MPYYTAVNIGYGAICLIMMSSTQSSGKQAPSSKKEKLKRERERGNLMNHKQNTPPQLSNSQCVQIDAQISYQKAHTTILEKQKILAQLMSNRGTKQLSSSPREFQNALPSCQHSVLSGLFVFQLVNLSCHFSLHLDVSDSWPSDPNPNLPIPPLNNPHSLQISSPCINQVVHNCL